MYLHLLTPMLNVVQWLGCMALHAWDLCLTLLHLLTLMLNVVQWLGCKALRAVDLCLTYLH
ncbi:MAG: hypothetical protein RSE58_14290, partial [Clostridia bacterium]